MNGRSFNVAKQILDKDKTGELAFSMMKVMHGKSHHNANLSALSTAIMDPLANNLRTLLSRDNTPGAFQDMSAGMWIDVLSHAKLKHQQQQQYDQQYLTVPFMVQYQYQQRQYQQAQASLQEGIFKELVLWAGAAGPQDATAKVPRKSARKHAGSTAASTRSDAVSRHDDAARIAETSGYFVLEWMKPSFLATTVKPSGLVSEGKSSQYLSNKSCAAAASCGSFSIPLQSCCFFFLVDVISPSNLSVAPVIASDR